MRGLGVPLSPHVGMLIVALGILPGPEDFLFLIAAVFLLTLLAFAINRASGIPYPAWMS